MTPLLALGLLVVMLACVALIPLGLPGLWAIVVITLGLVLSGDLSWPLGLGVAAAALVAEAAEFVVLASFGRAWGGSPRAFWGAVVGGMAGLFVGAPIPVVGPLIMAFVGTFFGAGLVTWMETRSLHHSARVGWGVLLARTVAVALKVAVAFAIISAVAFGLLV